jgi:hypothetical protein
MCHLIQIACSCSVRGVMRFFLCVAERWINIEEDCQRNTVNDNVDRDIACSECQVWQSFDLSHSPYFTVRNVLHMIFLSVSRLSDCLVIVNRLIGVNHLRFTGYLTRRAILCLAFRVRRWELLHYVCSRSIGVGQLCREWEKQKWDAEWFPSWTM